jgi:hypothetical protein
MGRRYREWAAPSGTFLARANWRLWARPVDRNSTPTAAGTIEERIWRTSPLTGFRDAPGQKPMVRKELFPEDKYARTFLHVPLDGLDVGDSGRGDWIAGMVSFGAAGLYSFPRPRHPWLGLRPSRECSRILDLREHAAPS